MAKKNEDLIFFMLKIWHKIHEHLHFIVALMLTTYVKQEDAYYGTSSIFLYDLLNGEI